MTLYATELVNYPNEYFVETGTMLGGGVQLALNLGFKNIISIEASKSAYENVKNKFEAYQNVSLYNGDSSLILFDCIKDIQDRITFWLDAHQAYHKDMADINIMPLFQEIEQIKLHPRKDHTILIDDVSMLKNNNGISVDMLEEKLLEINPEYKFEIINGHRDGNGVICEYILAACV